ncbi:putative cytochrome p450 [Diaporthe ampelina]|uniref:Putative cytochrome p450 n=1 Tax=Diaporthe ampelina TaxID=1214573 RepID=A0A0G2FE75_9PEZI|nr:putative cytochrome p450 [Diaporthe ampelina]
MSHPIPQPKGLPLVGNVLDVNPSNTWQSLQRLSERHGEIFQIKVLGSTIVFVAGAALAEEICDEKRFRKYVGGPIAEIRRAVHDALFTAFDHEETWGVAHRIVAPRLAPDAVREWCGEVVGCTEELMAKWKAQRGSGGGAAGRGVDLMDELNRLNLEATTLTMFGKKLDCITAAASHPMLQGMEDSTAEAMKRPTRPGLFNWLFFGGRFKRAIKVMREDYAADLVFHRKQNPTGRRDILWALMEGKDDQSGKGLTEEQVVDEIVSMPIGSSTAPCMIGSEIYLLLRNKQCIARAREELDRVVGPWSGAAAGGRTQIRAEHLPQLQYIEGIVRESLRLSFAAPGFNIEPVPRPRGPSGDADETPVLLAGGKYQVAHDQPMIIVLAGVNRDPAVFDEPLAFRPERMMGQSFDELPAGVKKWFGNGKRQCVGKHWAWQFNMVVTAMLIRECDFEMVDPDWKLDGHQDGWFNFRPVGLKVRVKPRVL